MSFRPAHPQPFTAVEAAQLDVGTIVAGEWDGALAPRWVAPLTTEISRLGNSLAHLASTQDELRAALADDDDAELRAALDENEGVIASQTERVEMLRHVLVDKVGADSLAHYGVEAPTSSAPSAPGATGSGPTHGSANGTVANGTSATPDAAHADDAHADDGLHL